MTKSHFLLRFKMLCIADSRWLKKVGCWWSSTDTNHIRFGCMCHPKVFKYFWTLLKLHIKILRIPLNELFIKYEFPLFPELLILFIMYLFHDIIGIGHHLRYTDQRTDMPTLALLCCINLSHLSPVILLISWLDCDSLW